jgi:NAD(P)-dependent dehydrogenase (short-subunit alcohol dehydrogenase family)
VPTVGNEVCRGVQPLTVMDRLCESLDCRFAESVTVIVNVDVPSFLGAPLIFPVAAPRVKLNANLLTTARLVRAALPHLEASGQGRICAITSYSVVQPIPTLALSNLARAGLWAWAKTAAQDLVPRDVTLNLISPGRSERNGAQAWDSPDRPERSWVSATPPRRRAARS